MIIEINDTTMGKTVVSLCHIKYIESFGHYVAYYLTDDNVLKERKTMNVLMEEMEIVESFVRCHRCYMVNIEFIKNIDYAIELIDGEIINIGRTWRTYFQKRYNTYVERTRCLA